MGQLWLAKNEDDPEETIGWIQSKHFFRLFQHFDMQEYKEKKGNTLVKIWFAGGNNLYMYTFVMT